MKLAKQKGAALLMAILITAITAMLAIAIIVEQRYLIHDSMLIENSDQMLTAIQGVQDWGMQMINQSIATPMFEGKPFQTEQKFSASFNNVNISGRIYDQQALFNINSLVNAAQQANFVRLLSAIDPDLASDTRIALAQAVGNWLRQGNADDDYYSRLKPPYRTAHQPMTDISELRLVKGFSAKLIQKLSPYISALPASQPTGSSTAANSNLININHAPAIVMLTLDPNISLGQAQALVSCVQSHYGFATAADFETQCVKTMAPKVADISSKITTKSHYFIVTGKAKIADQLMQINSFMAVLQFDKTWIPTYQWQQLR